MTGDITKFTGSAQSRNALPLMRKMVEEILRMRELHATPLHIRDPIIAKLIAIYDKQTEPGVKADIYEAMIEIYRRPNLVGDLNAALTNTPAPHHQSAPDMNAPPWARHP